MVFFNAYIIGAVSVWINTVEAGISLVWNHPRSDGATTVFILEVNPYVTITKSNLDISNLIFQNYSLHSDTPKATTVTPHYGLYNTLTFYWSMK